MYRGLRMHFYATTYYSTGNQWLFHTLYYVYATKVCVQALPRALDIVNIQYITVIVRKVFTAWHLGMGETVAEPIVLNHK